MPGIQVLDNNLINKIAAGEVVERPASVVKELLENAIDACASSITVEVKEGGLSYIRVADNGHGIPGDQVKSAFIRHATSKIQNFDDLEKVMSLGFRGEALASVAAVAMMEMVSKTAEEDAGHVVEINGGVFQREAESSATRGTAVTVRNLFYNTPARRKFLKKPSVEGGAISEIVREMAVGRPDIAFEYLNNGSELLRTKGDGDLKAALLAVYGVDITRNIIELNAVSNDIRLTGFIGKPSICRGNRGHELLFINGRRVNNALVRAAAENAYKTLLMQGKFPFYVMKLDMSPNLVDVNVHPAKLEVRFVSDEAVYNAVYQSVSSALKNDNLIPQERMSGKIPAAAMPTLPQTFKPTSYGQIVTEALYAGTAGSVALREDKTPTTGESAAPRHTPWSLPPDVKETIPQNEPPVSGSPPAQSQEIYRRLPVNCRIIGQAFGTYWFVEQGEALFVVDQHAAHERVLYEEVIDKARNGAVAAQMLLQPVAIRLSEGEEEIFSDNRELLERFGFDLEEFGEGVYALRGVPNIVKGAPDAGFFIEILDKLPDISTAVSDIHETKLDAIAVIACKAAVKANDRLAFPEAKALIERLMALENPYTCPHGRPTMIELTKYEIEKMFKRV